MVKKFLFIFLAFVSFNLKALPLEKILKANDAASLRSSVKEHNHKDFLKILCEKQKENKKPPTACYELFLSSDPWCFRLKVKELSLENLKKALQSSFLSSSCREYLKKKQKILFYRQKDFLLPELKNHWTAQKPFFYKREDAHSSQIKNK